MKYIDRCVHWDKMLSVHLNANICEDFYFKLKINTEMERTLNKHFRLLRQALSTTFINHLTLVTAKGLTRGLQHSLCRTSSSWALSIKFCQLLQDTTETTCMSCLSCRIANHGPETHTQVLLQGADSGLIYTATNKIFLMCCKVHYTSVTLDGCSELRKIQCIFPKKN